MKKRVLFATVVALACTSLTSCLKSDDWEMFNHPFNVTGEMHPTFGIPVGYGEMNMNDLLTSLSANSNGIISDTGDLITVEYTVTTSDTVFASDYMPSSKGVKHPASKRQGAKYKNGAKADAYTKDTVLETTIDIDFFDDVEILDSIFITHVWADLAVGFHGYFGDNPNIVQNLHVSFDSVEIWYDTPNSPTSVQFNDTNLSAFHVDINDLTVDSLYAFPTHLARFRLHADFLSAAVAVAVSGYAGTGFSFSALAAPVLSNLGVLLLGALFGVLLKYALRNRSSSDNRLIISVSLLFTF